MIIIYCGVIGLTIYFVYVAIQKYKSKNNKDKNDKKGGDK